VSGSTPIRPAATTVCLRDGSHGVEVLLIRRSRDLVFYGSAWAFPGGRVDAEDAPSGTDLFGEPAGRNAAVREAQEETAITLCAEALVPLSHWTTPPGRPRRFSTWFFVTDSVVDRVVVDEGEIEKHWWTRPTDALAAHGRKEIVLPPPTFVTLCWLLRFDRTAAALDAARIQALDRFVPRVVIVHDHVVSLYQGDAGYESRDPSIAGPRHRLRMHDEGWLYERD